MQYLHSDLYSQAMLLSDFADSRKMPNFLAAGLCNWTSETMLGDKMPDIVVFETEEARTIAATKAKRTNRVDPATYRKAGTYGGREWMKWLVSQGSAPGMPACFVDELGKLRGKELVKCTLVAEHWIETGSLIRLIRALNRGEDKSGFAFVKVFEQATDLKIAEFEEDWQRWLMGSEPSLVERITPEPTTKLDPNTEKALSHLEQLRKLAFAGEHMREHYAADSLVERAAIHYHADLSAQALRLAEHLAEKDAATDDDSVAKAEASLDELRAGGSWRVAPELIDLASGGAKESIDFWMASIYQRASLLDPSLLGIGFAKSGVVAIADAGSLVNDAEGFWAITWPPNKAKRVPIRHAELSPNPVPSVEPGTLGYPITLHLGPDVLKGLGFKVQLELHRDRRTGPLVDCWDVDAEQADEPTLGTRRVWSLIPKAPLVRGKSYHVRAVIHGVETWTLRWSFRT